jgi:DNA repair protein RecO (recombination protein O)
MALHETSGLVLKTFSLAEADKIVVFLTPDFGLIRGVAKGAKRLKSRFGGGLEPFSEVSLSIFQKEERELVSIRGIELQKSYFEVISNPLFLQNFSYLAELLLEFVPANEPNERIYRMTKVCLETASQNPENLESTTLYFELWLLKLGGYLPSWDFCENCKRKFGEIEETNLQINFQLLCSNCRLGKGSFSVRAEHRDIFRAAQRLSPENFNLLAKSETTAVRDVSDILKRIITHIIGKEIRSEKILAIAE